MADNRKLDSIVQIDGENYEVVAAKVAVPLTIKVVNGEEKTYTYDGSANPNIELSAVGEASHAATATVADVAKATQAGLKITTINNGVVETTTFNGSETKTITIGDANKIKVNMDDGVAYATITISAEEPTGNTGDIWFKHI